MAYSREHKKKQLLHIKNFYFQNRFSMFGALLKKNSKGKSVLFAKICMY
jgi:hypothetical protein